MRLVIEHSDKYFMYMEIISISAMILTIFIPYHLAMQTANMCIFFSSLFATLIGVYAVFKKVATAKIFVMAFGTLLIGVSATFLTILGIPSSFFFVERGFQLGGVLSCLLFSKGLHDIITTMRKDLRVREDRLLRLFDSAFDCLVTTRYDGTIIESDKNASDLFKVPMAKIINSNFYQLISDNNKENFILDSKLKAPQETVMMRGDGKYFFAEIIISDHSPEGEEPSLIIGIRDITSRKEAEEALVKADKLKDEFLTNTTHELKTPLNGIIGIAESLKTGIAGKTSPEMNNNLSLIASSGQRLLSLINDILDFSRIKHDQLELNFRPVNLYSIVESAIAIIDPIQRNSLISIDNLIPNNFQTVYADTDRLLQIMINLLGNSRKFTVRGSITISAEIIYNDEFRKNMAQVSVTDTGIGISSENYEKIFDSFTQADGTLSRRFGGAGLGLTITKKLVELHGGKIGLTSEKDNGSCFTFTLPLAEDSSIYEEKNALLNDNNENNYVISIEKNTNVSYRILVVDDDEINNQVIKNFLFAENLKVETVLSGTEALEIIQSSAPFDCILLDVMMPDMSGYDLCRIIRKSKSTSELPIILITARNRSEDINEGYKAGANDYIMKPVNGNELLSRLYLLLKKKDTSRIKHPGIVIEEKGLNHFFKFKDIIYLSSSGKSTVIHTITKDIEFSSLLGDVIQKLPNDIFTRIHRSFVINTDYLESIAHTGSGRYMARLNDSEDTAIPVGKSYTAEAKKALKDKFYHIN